MAQAPCNRNLKRSSRNNTRTPAPESPIPNRNLKSGPLNPETLFSKLTFRRGKRGGQRNGWGRGTARVRVSPTPFGTPPDPVVGFGFRFFLRFTVNGLRRVGELRGWGWGFRVERFGVRVEWIGSKQRAVPIGTVLNLRTPTL